MFDVARAAVLGAARSSDDGPGPPLTVERGPAREAAERELSKPVYSEHEPGPVRRALEWVLDRIFDVLQTTVYATPGGWVGLLVIAALVTALLVALRLRLGALRGAAGRRGRALFTDAPRGAAEHRSAAAEHAAAGRWAEAVREQMRGLVRGLEERALLEERPGRTADEAAAAAGRPMPALADRLRAAAATFDAVAYGGRPAHQRDYAELRELDRELRASTPELTEPAGVAR